MLQLPRSGGSATLSVTDKAMTSWQGASSHVHFPTYCLILLNLEKLGPRVCFVQLGHWGMVRGCNPRFAAMMKGMQCSTLNWPVSPAVTVVLSGALLKIEN